VRRDTGYARCFINTSAAGSTSGAAGGTLNETRLPSASAITTCQPSPRLTTDLFLADPPEAEPLCGETLL
jgi:hypothetical protein